MTFKACKWRPKVGREISPYLQLQRHFGTYKTSPIALKFCMASSIVISLLGIRRVKWFDGLTEIISPLLVSRKGIKFQISPVAAHHKPTRKHWWAGQEAAQESQEKGREAPQRVHEVHQEGTPAPPRDHEVHQQGGELEMHHWRHHVYHHSVFQLIVFFLRINKRTLISFCL